MNEQGKNDESKQRAESLLDQLFIAGLNDEECSELWASTVKDDQSLRRYVQMVHLREGLRSLLTQAEPRERLANTRRPLRNGNIGTGESQLNGLPDRPFESS